MSDDEDDDIDLPISSTVRPASNPWTSGFKAFFDAPDSRGGKPLVEWWGVCYSVYYLILRISDTIFKLNAARFGEVWASLAGDYLAIMASLVSSERAFSSAGITITKRRNRLKGDVVEALQFLKCYYRQKYSKLSTEQVQDDADLMEDIDDVVYASTDNADDIDILDIGP